MQKERIIKRKKGFKKKLSKPVLYPRISVYKSLKHIYAQILDDNKNGEVIVAISSLSPAIKEKIIKDGNLDTKKKIAREVGKLLGEEAISKGITKVIFDRSGYKYHGRIKELAEGAREKGLIF